jgi:hypothetical protein
MRTRRLTRIIREGGYLAEVDVQVMEIEGSWSAVMSLEDAQILDEVREALRQGDVQRAARLARVFTIAPIAI